MSDEPKPLDGDVDEVLRRVLPEQVSRERIRLLSEHADAVLDVRTRHRGAWLEMLGREVQLLVMDGFSPRLAQVAAKNNLGLRKRELDEELIVELCRLKDDLRKKVGRVIEDWEDQQ